MRHGVRMRRWLGSLESVLRHLPDRILDNRPESTFGATGNGNYFRVVGGKSIGRRSDSASLSSKTMAGILGLLYEAGVCLGARSCKNPACMPRRKRKEIDCEGVSWGPSSFWNLARANGIIIIVSLGFGNMYSDIPHFYILHICKLLITSNPHISNYYYFDLDLALLKRKVVIAEAERCSPFKAKMLVTGKLNGLSLFSSLPHLQRAASHIRCLRVG